MKKLTMTVFLTVLPMAATAQITEQSPESLVEEARALVQQFSGSLQGALQSAIQEGGLTNAIEVCQVAAPEMASDNSGGDWTISRTALKIRNPDNRPTAWQKLQLEAMQGQPVRNGRPVEVWQVSSAAEQPAFKYMSAIPTGGVCLGCHGDDVSAQVRGTLDELYPEDEALGFLAGELRGAFVVTYHPEGE